MHPIIRLTLISSIDAFLSILAFFAAFWLRLEAFPNDQIAIILVILITTIFSFSLLGVYMEIMI